MAGDLPAGALLADNWGEPLHGNPAVVPGNGAARVEAAPGRGAGRVGHVSRQVGGEGSAPVGPGNCRDQRLGVGVDRIGPDGGGVAGFHDPPQVHDGNPVGDLPDDRQVVGDQQQADVLLAHQSREQVSDLSLGGGVQGADWLIGDEARRAGRQGAGDRDPLPLSATELMREAVGRGRGQPNPFQQLDAAAPGRGPAAAAQSHAVANQIADLTARVQRLVRVLEHHLQPAQSAGPSAAAEHGHRLALEGGRPGGQRHQAGGGAGKRRFAASGFADQSDNLAAGDRQVNAVQGTDALPVAAVFHGRAAQRQY